MAVTLWPRPLVWFVDSWGEVMEACNALVGPRQNTLTSLLTAYAEPHRHYHNRDHIGSMLFMLKMHSGHHSPEYETLQLAAWYHDVVYDPRGSKNEEQSVEVATRSLTELGVSGDRIARVCALIAMTKTHEAPGDDRFAGWFLDEDLRILASDAVGYAKYAEAIRKRICLGAGSRLRYWPPCDSAAILATPEYLFL